MFKELLGGVLGTPRAATADVDVAQAQALQQEGALLIDVREAYEFQAGHAKGARSIPLSQLQQRVGEIEPTKTVLLICQSGGRSLSAQALLQRRQYADVRNVLGGTSAWQRAKLPMQ